MPVLTSLASAIVYSVGAFLRHNNRAGAESTRIGGEKYQSARYLRDLFNRNKNPGRAEPLLLTLLKRPQN